MLSHGVRRHGCTQCHVRGYIRWVPHRNADTVQTAAASEYQSAQLWPISEWTAASVSRVYPCPMTLAARLATTRCAVEQQRDVASRTISTRHNRGHHGSEVTNCYVTVCVGGNVGRIASGIPPFLSHFRAEGMILGTNNVVH